MSTRRAFVWTADDWCANPVVYRFDRTPLHARVVVAQSDYWYAGWVLERTYLEEVMWSRGIGVVMGQVYRRAPAGYTMTILGPCADEADALARGIEAMMRMIGQGEHSTPETRKFSDWVFEQYHEFRRSGILPAATQETIKITRMTKPTMDQAIEAPTKTETPQTQALAIVEPTPLARYSTPDREDYSNGSGLLHVQQQISCHDLKKALHEELDAEAEYRRRSAIHALRAGVLFHLFRQSMGITQSNFWAECEREFRVDKSTVSRKMRLAVQWAKEKGATEEQIMALAQAAELGDSTNPALQLAFDFIGELTTTDLYRKYGMVNPPRPRGGVVTPRNPDTGALERAPRRTLEEIAQADFDSQAVAWIGRAIELGQQGVAVAYKGAHMWDTATDDDLEMIRGYLADIKDGIVCSQGRRKAAGKGKAKR